MEESEHWKALGEHAGFFLQVLADINTIASRLRGSSYMDAELANGYMEACNTAIQAIRWILLPEEIETVKKYKPEFKIGKTYYAEMEYQEREL